MAEARTTTTAQRAPRHSLRTRELLQRVLIVDDDESDLEMIERKLGKLHCEVVSARTLAEAIKSIHANRIDAVVLDLALTDATDLDGLARLTAAAPEMPIVVLTGNDNDELGTRSLQHGAQDYLEKSALQDEQLPRALNYAVSRKQSELLRQRLAHTDRLASIGTLAASVAHEINNPLTFLMTNMTIEREHLDELAGMQAALADVARDAPALAALLRRTKLGERLAEMLEMVEDNLEGVERIRTVARELRGFARTEQKEYSSVDLNEVAKTAANITRNEVRHIATLELHLARLPLLVGDYGRLCQLLVNLIINAAHAIGEGTTSRDRIDVTTATDDGYVTITVVDTGSGIAPEAIDRLFEAFFTTKARDVGTGLGLALCAETARLHGGEIVVTSELGKGATFELRLPCDTGLALGAPTTALPPPTPDRPATILLIDDDMNVRRAFGRMLSRRGHRVVEASGGERALELLARSDDFDAILCDLVMPDMDGSEFFEHLRDRHPRLVERTIFVSGGAFTLRARAFLDREAPQVLQKPASPEALEEAIQLKLGSLPPRDATD